MSNPKMRDYVLLYLYHRYARLRFAWMRRMLKGRVDFAEGCDIWPSCLHYTGAGRVRFGPGAVLERGPHKLVLDVEPGSEIDIGPRVFFRTKYCSNALTGFEGGRIEIGEDTMLNGCVISSRESVRVGLHCSLSWRVVILDSILHQISNSEGEKTAAVKIGDHCWLGNSVIVMPGVTIGSHTVVGAGSVVTKSLPGNVIAAGTPAKAIREIDDRDKTR